MEQVTSELFLKNVSNFIGSPAGGTNHKFILQEYGKIDPLPRGYKPTLNDPWCAIFVSAMWEYLGPNKWFPYECSCIRMIEKLIAKNYFINSFAIKESSELNPGWLIFYDWERDGSPDHVGFIKDVEGEFITTIEGNYGGHVAANKVGFKTTKIYGYGILEYDVGVPDEFEIAKKFVSEAIMLGDGTDTYWEGSPTREQLAVILYRYKKYLGL